MSTKTLNSTGAGRNVISVDGKDPFRGEPVKTQHSALSRWATGHTPACTGRGPVVGLTETLGSSMPVPHPAACAARAQSRADLTPELAGEQCAQAGLYAYPRLQDRSKGEAFTMGIIVAAATAAIAYGVGCGAGLVQNWELFETGIRNLVQ